LFPISLSNQAFSTARVLPLLENLSARYRKIVFLVADHLQIYNKALRVGEDVNFSDLVRTFDSDQEYLEQRRAWIERLSAMLQMPPEERLWTVIGVEEMADSSCFKIFRNVMLLYYADQRFQQDIDALALRHASSRNEKYPLERRVMLSKGYILEEIAISIRIHVLEGISDEYYLGAQVRPLLRLYGGGYGVTVEDLAQHDRGSRQTRFFRYDEGAQGTDWQEESQI
jgi:hypothetical protein